MPPQERRRQLPDATLTIIIRDGYGAVSIEMIARGLVESQELRGAMAPRARKCRSRPLARRDLR